MAGYGNTKTSSMHRRLGSEPLSQLAFHGESSLNFPWKKSRVPRLSPRGLSPRRLSPREDDIRDFRPASVALGEPFFFSEGNYFSFSPGTVYGFHCGSSPETGKVTEIMNCVVNS